MGKLEDIRKLNREGKVAEARAKFEELRAKAKTEPDEFIQETGRPLVFKRRGRLVVQDEGGDWKLKNPPQRKKKARSGKP